MSGLSRLRDPGRGLLLCGLGVALVIGATTAVVRGRAATAGPPPPASGLPAVQPGAPDSLGRAIGAAQEHLRTQPQDWRAWADLGFAYVQEARVSVDPAYYPKADGAIQRSLSLHPQANVAAMIAAGSLAAARHDFSTALDWAQRAVAVDPHNAAAFGVLDDALTQLGRYPQATAAVQRMLDLQPGLASFSRASYDFEEHGDVVNARAALLRAVGDASSPADSAFAHYYLGELAFNSGDLTGAAAEYTAARTADPSAVAPLEGMARVEAARGQTDAAVRDYTEAISRVPQPTYVLELGELEQSLGRTQEAQRQYRLLGTEERLFAANGVNVDLELTLFDADHGSAADALRHGQAIWARQHSVLAADALAWSLHAAGRDAEALDAANSATALGWHNALLYAHRGLIERSLGQATAARADLQRALQINPHFSVLLAPLTVEALAALGGAR